MLEFNTMEDLMNLCEKTGLRLSDLIIRFEAERSDRSETDIIHAMRESLDVMRAAVQTGLSSNKKSFSGLVGGDAAKLSNRLAAADSLAGETSLRAAAYALAVSEVNASMGRIVACPTAGSCGILPGALLAAAEKLHADDNAIIAALFTSAGIGMVIAENASIAGATGGCQAECGSAAAMAAGAIVELAGGSPRQVGQALALALKNLLGLVCDPVAGLVEVPCVRRNAFGAAHALLAAELALAGVESVIPADEVILAMHTIGQALPRSLRETSEGGLAQTPTGKKITDRLSKGQPADNEV